MFVKWLEFEVMAVVGDGVSSAELSSAVSVSNNNYYYKNYMRVQHVLRRNIIGGKL